MPMTERTFMLTVDLLDPTLDLDAVKEFIKTSPLFDNWWNHIPGVFLVVSSQDAGRISAAIRKYTHEARLLVVEVNPSESDGWLTEKGWKWIRRRSGQSADEPVPT
jgi:hypothetical protein